MHRTPDLNVVEHGSAWPISQHSGDTEVTDYARKAERGALIKVCAQAQVRYLPNLYACRWRSIFSACEKKKKKGPQAWSRGGFHRLSSIERVIGMRGCDMAHAWRWVGTTWRNSEPLPEV